MLCAGYEVSYECHRVDVDATSGKGLEAAARQARFKLFERLIKPNDVLLLGHHLDDQVETLLYRLLRGSGPKGLSAIPSRRSLGQGQLLRPMLAVPRSTITQWVADQTLPFIDDPSNADTRLDRNYLRHSVLPTIERRWPRYRDTLARAVALQQTAATILGELPLTRIEGPFGEPGLLLDDEETEQRLVQRLYHWLVADGYMSPGQRRLGEYARQCLQAHPERTPELTLEGASLYRWRQGIYRLDADSVGFIPPKAAVVGDPVTTLSGTLCWDRDDNGLPQGLKLQVRRRLPGEKLALINGPTRSFKRQCQAAGIPPWWRDKLLVLCADETPVAITGLGLLRSAQGLGRGKDFRGYSPRWCPNWRTDLIE